MRHATMPDVVMKLMEGRARVAKGWCQGEFSLPIPENLGGEKVCALGAVRRPHVDPSAEYALICALPTSYCCITEYNDEPGRTQADILALFDRAIAEACR